MTELEKGVPPPDMHTNRGPTIVHVQQPTTTVDDRDKIIMVLLIFLLPPLAVWYRDKYCSSSVCLNICLTLCFVLPGVIHAVWHCLIKRDGIDG